MIYFPLRNLSENSDGKKCDIRTKGGGGGNVYSLSGIQTPAELGPENDQHMTFLPPKRVKLVLNIFLEPKIGDFRCQNLSNYPGESCS